MKHTDVLCTPAMAGRLTDGRTDGRPGAPGAGVPCRANSKSWPNVEIKCFNERINTKIKDSKHFHQALKNFSVVESKINSNDSCTINATALNEAFLKNNNAKVNETLVTDECSEILKKSKN